MTRIGIVSQWYDPEGGSAVLPGIISRSLVALGHEVHVVTGFPNYPSGKLHADYRLRPYQYETMKGVHVHRVPLFPSHDGSAVKRTANYLSFAASAAARLDLLRTVDVWLVYSSPATVALPAMVARWLHKRPYVILVEDMWPDTLTDSDYVRPGRHIDLIVRMLHRFCDLSYRQAAHVAVITPGMADILASRGVPQDKLSVVYNWVDERLFHPRPRDPQLAASLGLSGFVVMYAGSMGNLQGLEVAVDAMDHLADIADLTLVFAGSGVEEQRLRESARRCPPGRVVFLGHQPLERMIDLMPLGDVQLISLRDRPLHRKTMPSKVQSSLACGRPIVAALAGDAARLVDESGAGFVAPPGDSRALADAIRRMYELGAEKREEMGRNGRQFYLDRLSEPIGSVSLANLLEQAVRDHAAR
ncbi:glycosyltransferase family 4 protein [Verrucosispora sp. FIM060022]|uniref:glycosyltransferase family 4 protein n=1 Tax=Verrucosispora sp. FIM060022 TaxID=1479020 RepID=UPI00131553C1|nr:glycosyltransferase family 4 protein [Verrucosispora sp. FIM060022]